MLQAADFISEEKKEFFVLANEAIKKLEISRSVFEDIYYRPVAILRLHFLVHYDLELKKPIKVIIERGKYSNSFIVSNEEVNKYGIGSSKEEALDDFESNLVEDYLMLKNLSEDELTEDAKELLSLYESYFEE